MNVSIQTESSTFVLDVNRSEKIETLYNKVAKATDLQTYQFELIFNDEILNNFNLEVTQYDITEQSTIRVKLIKDLKFYITRGTIEYVVTFPNNHCITMQNLIDHIKINLPIPELNRKEFQITKDGRTFQNTLLVHSNLKNRDHIDFHILDSSSASTTDVAKENDSIVKNFVQTSKSSKVELVICIDTSAYMSSVIKNILVQVEELVSRLINDIPNIMIGIVGLGNYVDWRNVVTKLDFTGDLEKLVHFIKKLPQTSGSDHAVAYEWAFNKVKQMSWSENSSKALVVIGDTVANEPAYTDLKLNWIEETDDLYDMGVKIYGVKSINSENAFLDEISARTGGVSIHAQEFSVLTSMFLSILNRDSLSNSSGSSIVKTRGVPLQLRTDAPWFDFNQPSKKTDLPVFISNKSGFFNVKNDPHFGTTN